MIYRQWSRSVAMSGALSLGFLSISVPMATRQIALLTLNISSEMA
jgi:hypothetical protein